MSRLQHLALSLLLFALYFIAPSSKHAWLDTVVIVLAVINLLIFLAMPKEKN